MSIYSITLATTGTSTLALATTSGFSTLALASTTGISTLAILLSVAPVSPPSNGKATSGLISPSPSPLPSPSPSKGSLDSTESSSGSKLWPGPTRKRLSTASLVSMWSKDPAWCSFRTA